MSFVAFRMSFPVLSISAPARHLVLTWFIPVRKETKKLTQILISASVSNIWRWWGWPSELPGVYCHDERQNPQRPQDLQQTGGLGGIQALYQTRNEGIIIDDRYKIIDYWASISLRLHLPLLHNLRISLRIESLWNLRFKIVIFKYIQVPFLHDYGYWQAWVQKSQIQAQG